MGTGDLNGPTIIYSDLIIDEDMVSVKWTSESCSSLFELQGYTYTKITTHNLEVAEPDNTIRINGSNNAVIPSSNFTTTHGDSLYYRLVALFDNLTICSAGKTKIMFYRFDGMLLSAW